MLVIPSLFCGGVERVVATMANYWVRRGRKITVLTFDDGTIPPFYELHSEVGHLPLSLAKESSNIIFGLKNNIGRILALRKAIIENQPEVIISFIVRTNIRILLSTAGLKFPVIVCERADPLRENPGWIWKWLRKKMYSSGAQVVTHTRTAADYFSKILDRRVWMIPNMVEPEAPKKNGEVERRPVIIGVGRLEEEKGFDLLVQAFADIADQFPGIELKIWGEGSQRKKLEDLRSQLGLENRVFFPGLNRDIRSAFREAEIFVLSSRFEGFGNALCEAMVCGLPVIATDCIGPREIIRQGVDGLLVPIENVEALAIAMRRLLNDADERRRLAFQAQRVLEKFSVEKIMAQWDVLIAETIGSK